MKILTLPPSGVYHPFGGGGAVRGIGLEHTDPLPYRLFMIKSPFQYFKTSPEIIQMAVMMYVRYPLSLRSVEDLLHERGIDTCHESVRTWVDRFGTFFAWMIRKRRAHAMRLIKQWRWHLDEVFVKIAGETHYCGEPLIMKASSSKLMSPRPETRQLP